MNKTLKEFGEAFKNLAKYGHSGGFEHTEWYRKEQLKEEALKHNDGMDSFRYSVEADERYNTPKEKHKASEEDITKTIEETEIYRKAKERILKAQRGQVGYGIDKYPEPLNADTWTIFETLDHAMDESIDRMHYFEMLRIKFEQMENELEELREYKRNTQNLFGGPFVVKDREPAERTLYSDEFVYPLTYIGGADHDGDVVYPKSDANHYKENNDEESTYIKNCKKATEVQPHISLENVSAQDFVRLVNGVVKELKTGGM